MFRELYGREGRDTVRAGGGWIATRKQQFIDRAGLVHTGAYRDEDSIPKFCATSNKPNLSRDNAKWVKSSTPTQETICN